MLDQLNSYFKKTLSSATTISLLGVGLSMGIAANANATSIHSQGNLLDGVTEYGSVSSNNSYDDPFTASFFSFSANEGEEVSIEVLRLEHDFDPHLWIFEGTIDDTSYFAGGESAGIDYDDPGFLTYGDDEIDNDGPFGDPLAVFNATLSGTGKYTAIVTSFISGDDDGGDGAFNFQITASNVVNPVSEKVPEPASLLGLLTVGVMGIGSTLKHKKK